ncbi:MAG: hypothetical protein KDD92_12745 [Caldilineaceae bacterium]|nr:hypothetical protein [Caldilineaceae bacterium]
MNSDGAVWLGGINRIWRSRDRGETWAGMAGELFDSDGQEEIVGIVFAPDRPNFVAVHTYLRILVSQSDGERWVVAHGATLNTNNYPSEVDIAPGDEVMLTAALGQSGIFTRTLEIEEEFLPVMKR